MPNRVNQKLRDSAKDCPYCMGCGLINPNGDRLCLAHSNRLQDGKGRGIKATDETGAILCHDCHDYVDGRNGRASHSTRAEMQDFHYGAHCRTRVWWQKIGLVE